MAAEQTLDPGVRAPLVDAIVGATLVCVARYGVAKTTLDDVAREAGCARATVYRHFGGKGQLLAAAVAVERARILATITEAAAARETLEDALVAMSVTAARELEQHRALQFLLAHEPETILPAVTFEGGDRFLADVAVALAPTLARFVPEPESAAEWCARVFVTFLGAQDAPVALTDEHQVRELVRAFVVPALAVPSSSARS